jgi:hypothetical protein
MTRYLGIAALWLVLLAQIPGIACPPTPAPTSTPLPTATAKPIFTEVPSTVPTATNLPTVPPEPTKNPTDLPKPTATAMPTVTPILQMPTAAPTPTQATKLVPPVSMTRIPFSECKQSLLVINIMGDEAVWVTVYVNNEWYDRKQSAPNAYGQQQLTFYFWNEIPWDVRLEFQPPIGTELQVTFGNEEGAYYVEPCSITIANYRFVRVAEIQLLPNTGA